MGRKLISSVYLAKPGTNTKVLHLAGTEVSDEAVAAITSPFAFDQNDGWAAKADQGEPDPYDVTVTELEKLIDDRNADRADDQHLSKKGVKADLQATLRADDATRQGDGSTA